MTSSPAKKLISLKSPTRVGSVATSLKRRDVSPVFTKTVYYSNEEGEGLGGSGRENDSEVDLREILNKQKSKQKHFASAVTVTSGFMSSSQPPQFESDTGTPPVNDDWSGDEEMDSVSSAYNSSENSSETEKLRSLKKASRSKHSSSSRRHKRKHSLSKTQREKEKKRKKAKEYSEIKKKPRREKERERERAKKRKKHKKSEKYSMKI